MTPRQETEQRALFTVAHHDYEKAMNVHAFFKMHDHAVGEDMVQATFMKTWSYLVKGGEIVVMKAFLYHVLNNLIVDEYRKRKTVSLDILMDKGFEPSAGPSAHPGLMLDTLDAKAITILILRLPIAYQKVVRMRYLQDLSLKEMALITGKTKNTMAVQVHRALKKLKLLSLSTDSVVSVEA